MNLPQIVPRVLINGVGGAETVSVTLATTVPVCVCSVTARTVLSLPLLPLLPLLLPLLLILLLSKAEDPAHHEYSPAASESASATADESASISLQVLTSLIEPDEDPALIPILSSSP